MAGARCVDGSFILAMLLREPSGAAAELLLREWQRDGDRVLGPPLLFAEVTSVLRESVHFGRLSMADGEAAFSEFERLQLFAAAPGNLQRLAWELAKRYNRPRAYDAQYLAAARSENCDLWTADARLANAVGEAWVRLLE